MKKFLKPLFTGLFIFLVYRCRKWIIARFLGLYNPQNAVTCTQGIRLKMPDGVTLHCDHYKPANPGKYPTILIRSPYGRNSHAGVFGALLMFFANRFAERGYNVIVQDVRGRCESEGEFRPFFNEKKDGETTARWIIRQEWSNGLLGLWGPSYLGITQWAIAKIPEVTAFMPIFTASHLRGVVQPDGAFDLGMALRWAAALEITNNFLNRPFFQFLMILLRARLSTEQAEKHIPLIEADKALTHQEVIFYREWLDHLDEDDPMWRKVYEELDLTQIEKPSHFIGGWYDFFLRDMLKDYSELKVMGVQPYLTIGPWHHFNQINGMNKGIREGITWFDHYLKGYSAGIRQQPVRVYVMGLNRWYDFADWPPVTACTPFYLHGGYRLELQPAFSPIVSQYVYDPADPTPAVGGTQFLIHAGAVDNRALEARPDVLTFTSEVLPYDTTLVGHVCLRLYVRSSLEYTDFYGGLCDVHPNGKSINICDGLFRIKPGLGERQPDGSLCIEIDMWATAHCFRQGHRIRLQVSSGAHPRWNRNFGHGEPISTTTRLCVAHQTIYHDEAHPSALFLPVLQR